MASDMSNRGLLCAAPTTPTSKAQPLNNPSLQSYPGPSINRSLQVFTGMAAGKSLNGSAVQRPAGFALGSPGVRENFAVAAITRFSSAEPDLQASRQQLPQHVTRILLLQLLNSL